MNETLHNILSRKWIKACQFHLDSVPVSIPISLSPFFNAISIDSRFYYIKSEIDACIYIKWEINEFIDWIRALNQHEFVHFSPISVEFSFIS